MLGRLKGGQHEPILDQYHSAFAWAALSASSRPRVSQPSPSNRTIAVRPTGGHSATDMTLPPRMAGPPSSHENSTCTEPSSVVGALETTYALTGPSARIRAAWTSASSCV